MLPPHTTTQGKTYDLLSSALRGRYLVRAQVPLSLAVGGEPEPDVAVVPGTHDDYAQCHPTTALLVIEVSDVTLSFDRRQKASLYARADVPDYWVLNVPGRRLEIRRDPQPDEDAPFGFSYGSLQTFAETARVTPLCAPDVSISISDLLPVAEVEASG